MITPLASRFEGRYYDGHTPRRYDVAVELDDGVLRIVLRDADPLLWKLDEIHMAADGGDGEPVRMELGGETLVVDDARFLDAMRQHTPGYRGGSSILELRGWRAVLIGCAAVGLIAGVLYFWGVRLMADAAARVAPQFLEERLGRGVINLLAPQTQRCSNRERERLLARVTDRLIAAAPKTGYQFRIIYVDSPMINAMAAPGGYIVVFRGILEEMHSPEELAGVLAHEMQHVIHRHSTRAIARELSMRTLMSMMALDSSGTPGAFRGTAQLLSMSYQRDDETEADGDGMALLKRAHIATNGLETLLRRMQLEGHMGDGSTSYLSSHPAALERAARLEKKTGDATSSVEPLMTQEEWSAARIVCTPVALRRQ